MRGYTGVFICLFYKGKKDYSISPVITYSATPLTLLKLCVCVLHDMRMCMWFAYNCCINFCQFSPFIYRLSEHIPYNTIPILCPLLKLMLHLCPPVFLIFVAPALAGRHRRASFRPFVRSSVRTFIRSYVRPPVHPSTLNMGIF